MILMRRLFLEILV